LSFWTVLKPLTVLKPSIIYFIISPPFYSLLIYHGSFLVKCLFIGNIFVCWKISQCIYFNFDFVTHITNMYSFLIRKKANRKEVHRQTQRRCHKPTSRRFASTNTHLSWSWRFFWFFGFFDSNLSIKSTLGYFYTNLTFTGLPQALSHVPPDSHFCGLGHHLRVPLAGWCWRNHWAKVHIECWSSVFVEEGYLFYRHTKLQYVSISR
jgi:hypothetical protein